MTGILYVVATPIGNLDDLSPRAALCLQEARTVYAEDTRHVQTLLAHCGAAPALRSLHGHNETQRIGEAIAALMRGETIAVVSDAGTPTVSDPGAALVSAALDAGLMVRTMPGPSALTAALSVAGYSQHGDNVLFMGFLPHKGGSRSKRLEQINGHAGLVVLFEAPHRVRRTLAELAALDPARSVCLCRELSKRFEEVRRGMLAAMSTADTEERGEYTLVIGPRAEVASSADAAIDIALQRCRDVGLSTKDCVAAVAAILDCSRRLVYQRAQELK